MRFLVMASVLSASFQTISSGDLPATAQQSNRTMSAPQAAFMAQVTPMVCPRTQTDYVALRSFMQQHHLSQQDLTRTDRRGPEMLQSFASFEQAYTVDADRACQAAFGTLGPDGPGLLVHDGE